MVMLPRTSSIAQSTVLNSILALLYNLINTPYSTSHTEDKEINSKYNVLFGNYSYT